MISATFVGNPNTLHVSQPVDSELCFAAVASSALGGVALEAVHQSLRESFISDDDGSTAGPFGSQGVTIAGQKLGIEPIYAYRDDMDTTGVIELIDGQLSQGNQVALLHKKVADPADGRYHWILLAGYEKQGGQVTSVAVMDPEAESVKSVDPLEVVDMIERSIEFNTVYAYALKVNKEEK